MLNEDTVIEYGVDIDLNGYQLNLNGKSLIYDFDDEGIFYIYSGISGGTVYGGNITVNAPGAVVLNKGVFGESVNFAVTESGFIDIFTDSIQERIRGGIAGTFNYIGDFAEYIDVYYNYDEYLPFAVSSDGSAAYFDGDYLNVINSDCNKDIFLTFNFNNAGRAETVSARVLGETESIISRIEAANNFAFAGSTAESRYTVRGDLFLPQTDKLLESSVMWISSRGDILSGGGKYTRPYHGAEFELSAVYSVNGENIMVTYYLSAQSKTVQEKIDEVAGIFGTVVFVEYSEEAAAALPRVADFAYMGFTEFEYTLLPEDGNILTVYDAEGGYYINLLKSVEEYSTYIIITGSVGEESAQSRIGVYVDIIKNVSIFDAAHRYVQTHLNHIAGSTYNSFILPSYYLDGNTAITYEIKDGENSIVSAQTVYYANPDDVTGYVQVFNGDPSAQPATNGGVSIDREKVPVSNTPVYIEVTVTNGGISDTRLINFSVTGLLHYGEDIEDITLFHLLRRICDADFDWYISADEAQSVTQLPADWTGKDNTEVSFAGKGISSIGGLEYFINLQSVDLSGNNISDLSPLSQLYNLKVLKLSGNGIDDVSPLAMLLNLEELDLSANNITDISGLKNLKSLIKLNLSYNRSLTSFQAIEGYERLKELNLFRTDGIDNSTFESRNLNYLISAYDRADDIYAENAIAYYTASASAKWKPVKPYDIDANRILSSVSISYQFADVLYLPHKIWYGNNEHVISWSAEGFENIIQIVQTGADSYRAYITQPSSSVDVKIYASLFYGTRLYYRAFDILSKHDEGYESELEIEISENNFEKAYEIIEDDTLRYYLFRHFDADPADGVITRAEIAAKSAEALRLNGLGIKSIKGLQYFNGIQILYLKNNFIDSISYLSGIVTLKELSLNGGEYDFSALSQMTNLMILNVYGCKNLNGEDALSDLFTVYKNNSVNRTAANQIKIYKDSGIEPWNPYRESAAMALKGIQSVYALSYGEARDLQKYAEVSLYDGDSEDILISYAKPAGMTYTISKDSVDSNQKIITASQISAADKYEILNASITYQVATNQSVTVTARLTVVIKAVTDVKVQWHDESFKDLFEVVKNSGLRQYLLTSVYQGTDITREQLSAVTSLNFNYENDGLGLKNLELFYGQDMNLQELIISYYSPLRYGAYYDGLTFLHSDNFEYLNSLTFNYSVVDVYGLQNIKGQLASLKINYCANVILYGSGDVFDGFDDLTTLEMTNCGITNFTALEQLSGIINLKIHDNPASASYKTDSSVNTLFENTGYNPACQYFVTSSSVLWVPQDNSYIASTITDLHVNIKDLSNNVFGANYGAHNPNYDIAGGEYIPDEDNEGEYILDGGYKILLPLNINLKGVDYPIEWSSAAPETINTADAAVSGGFKECRVAAQALKAYVVIEGVVQAFSKSVKYVFVVDANENLTPDLGSFDIEEELMSGGRFYDPVFAYRVLSLPSVMSGDTDGVFSISAIEGVSSMNLQAADNLLINNITGISNFIGLTTLNLQNNAINDITELYHLVDLTDLRLNGNTINTLYYDETNDTGIFDNMSNLQILHIHECYNITDYMPVAKRNDSGALKKLHTLYIYNGTNNIYIDNFNRYAAVKAWWNERDGQSGNTYLRLFRNNNLRQNGTAYTQISDVVDRLYALDNVGDQILTSTPFELEGVASYGVNSYFLEWEFYGDAANVMTLNGREVGSLTAESQKTNHKIPMLVYIDYYVGSRQHKVGKIVYLNLQHLPEPEDMQLSIQLRNQQEFERYDAQYTYEKDGNYYVYARHAIPDGMLMNCLFNHFNRTTIDHIIDIYERDNPFNTLLNIQNRGITDITGIELFPKLKRIYLTNNKIAVLPDLPVSADSEVYEIRFNGNNFLRDITLLNNVNFRSKITTLYLNNCYNIKQEQLDLLSDIPLTFLNIRGVNYHNLDFVLDIQDYCYTLNKLFSRIVVSNNIRATSNGNLETLHKFYLRRNEVRDAEGIPAQIFENYIRLHQDYPSVVTGSTTLPDSFEMYGEEYGIVWSKVTGQPYEIDYDGVNNKYIITLGEDTGDSVQIYARAVYNGTQTYRQTLTLRTESLTLPQPYVSDAQFNGGLLSEIMPDEVLRYFVIAAADTNGDGEITAAEAQNFTVLNINNGVTSSTLRQAVHNFEGIQHFTYLVTLDINFCGAADFSPLEALVNLQSLSVRNNLRAVSNFDFILPLQNLTSLTLTSTLYNNLSFIADLPLLETLAGISADNSQDRVSFVKSAWAYARLAGSLKENAADMGGVLTDHISTADEKEAAFILSLIEADFITDMGFAEFNGGESYDLPDTVSYLNQSIDIHWISLSDLFEINGYALSAYENEYYSSGGIACYIEYNGKYYYRYWQAEVL